MIDKIFSFACVVAGLAFLAFVPAAQQTGPLFVVGIVVVIGGVLGLVNAQMLAPILQLLEKQLGGIPLPVSPAQSLPTVSLGASSGPSSTSGQVTSVTPDQNQAAYPPGTMAGGQ